MSADPVALVEGQLAAYNDHDLERFCSFFAADVEVALFGSDQPALRGMDAFRRRYTERFAGTPDIHCTITQRLVQGQFVIDQERLTMSGAPERSVVAIYQVDGDLIRRVWFIEGQAQ